MGKWTRWIGLRIGLCALLAMVGCGGGRGGGGDPAEGTRLANLLVGDGTLAPAFAPNTTSYAVGPERLAATTTVKPTAETAGATITVDGDPVASGAESGPIDLDVGLTTVEVRVTAPGGGASTLYTVDFSRGIAGQSAYIKASNAGDGDFFGARIDVHGDTMVVGAPTEDGDGSSQSDDSAPEAGAAYVFVRSGGVWTQQAYLKASNAQAGDWFGAGVGIYGDTIVVAAPFEDSKSADVPDEGAEDSGAAYVFVRTGTTWTEQAYLKASNPDPGDELGAGWQGGNAVDIWDDTIVVGAQMESGPANARTFSGAAYVFVRDGGAWSEQAVLRAQNADIDDRFGTCAAIHDDTIVIGARGEDGDGSAPTDNSEEGAGAAYVFHRVGTTWFPQAYLKATFAEEFDFFGTSIDVWEHAVVIGAPGEQSDGSSAANNDVDNSGAVYVFERVGTVWSPTAYLKALDPGRHDQFGVSVGIGEDTIGAGAWDEDGDGSSPTDDSVRDSGAVYVFLRTIAGWEEGPYLKASNLEEQDRVGNAVRIPDKGSVLIGGYWEDGNGSSQADNSEENAGAVYEFR